METVCGGKGGMAVLDPPLLGEDPVRTGSALRALVRSACRAIFDTSPGYHFQPLRPIGPAAAPKVYPQ
jgi:hypothetical protein